MMRNSPSVYNPQQHLSIIDQTNAPEDENPLSLQQATESDRLQYDNKLWRLVRRALQSPGFHRDNGPQCL